jgi:selenocysteine-specific elongation factor
MIVGTAGHIDHGKTTLVKALTGVDCDRLKEEKARGITLDLGYAYTAQDGAEDEVLGFIDVPGHEKLIHNMLAGATGIDCALLVVAADDGPMPQTLEHLGILELLGLSTGAVALTKVDRVEPARVQTVRREIEALLAHSSLSAAPVFPVAAIAGQGVAELRAHLLRLGARPSSPHGRTPMGGFRLAVDRSFTLTGIGTVVTGTVFSGSVRQGDSLVLSPSGRRVRVRSLRAQDREASRGVAGQRVALALSGVEKADVTRGMWVLDQRLHAPIRRFDAQLRVLPDQAPLRHWSLVHVHLGAEDVLARVALLESEEIGPGGCGLAQLLLERELGALSGDRFILRDAAARHTLGGGSVVDAFPPARHRRTPERLAMLRALSDADPAIALEQAARTQPAGVDLARHALNRNLDTATVGALVERLALVVAGDAAFCAQQWLDLAARMLAALTAEHERAPDMPGVERDRLRRLTMPTLPRTAFDVLLGEQLAAGAVARSGSWLHLPAHRMQLAAGDSDLWRVLRPMLEHARFNPPRVRDIAQAGGFPEDRVRELLRRLARVGEVYPVAHDHYFLAEAVAELADLVAKLAAADGIARAAALRDRIGGGRKVAIHILEFFDRIGYTRRARDVHVLRGSPEQFA